MCMMMCEAKCECPKPTPILKDGRCIAESACSSAASAAATPACIPNPRAKCTREYRPVCAEGKTYANACLAAAECKTLSYKGQCDGAGMTHG
mmetsp:Transcript_26548/g.61969  ORF Transcript_26548/g.61969 Transcript_26548/m.61969 type:complete len:92 (-) Transcript_26548:813-1088(-)